MIERLYLNVDKKECVSEIISAKNNNIWLGKVKKLELSLFAINTLHKLVLHEENEMEEFCLIARVEEYVSEVIKEEKNSIWLGKVKKLELSGCSVNILHTRTLKNLKLWSYAINALPKLHGENEIEELVIADVDRKCCSKSVFSSDIDFCSRKIKMLRIDNSAIDFLRIRKGKDCVLDPSSLFREKKKKTYISKHDISALVSI
ncbi:MAG: uncharacterized protein A8A55_2715 [Amphiamblys sp. WSBS2006]|nr:MAG: uncharacterized protein A8A55_2715 [Amphiamblys sp. WSBS2006]